MKELPMCQSQYQPRYKSAPLLLVLTLLAASSQAAEPKPGLWNITINVTAEGAAQSYGPYSSSQCFSAEDMRNPETLLAGAGGAECSYSDINHQENRFIFNVQCGGTIPMSGSGNVDYTSDTFQGNLDITADLQGLPIATKSHVTGAYAGTCSASPK